MLDLKKTHLKETVMKKLGIVLTLACVVSFAQMMWAQAAPAGQIPDETVVAKIDGKSVTAGEVRDALATMPSDFGKLYQQDPKLAIQQLYVLRHLAEEGEKAKLGEQSPMKEQLEIMRANVLASAMLSREHNNYGVSEEMIKEYYERNQAKFQRAKIKLISIAFKPAVPAAGAAIADIARATAEAAASKTQRSEADARKLAEDLVKQTREGADFNKLVEQYSEDAASKAAGGDFGLVNFNSGHSADIKSAVMALKPGEVTDPIRQSSAFYVIRVDEKTVQNMQEVMEPIIQDLRQAHVNEWFTAIRNRFALVVENPRFFAQPPRGQPTPPLPPVPGAPAGNPK